jgi:hypothetical protein
MGADGLQPDGVEITRWPYPITCPKQITFFDLIHPLLRHNGELRSIILPSRCSLTSHRPIYRLDRLPTLTPKPTRVSMAPPAASQTRLTKRSRAASKSKPANDYINLVSDDSDDENHCSDQDDIEIVESKRVRVIHLI